jgi:hypothetical protein
MRVTIGAANHPVPAVDAAHCVALHPDRRHRRPRGHRGYREVGQLAHGERAFRCAECHSLYRIEGRLGGVKREGWYVVRWTAPAVAVQSVAVQPHGSRSSQFCLGAVRAIHLR